MLAQGGILGEGGTSVGQAGLGSSGEESLGLSLNPRTNVTKVSICGVLSSGRCPDSLLRIMLAVASLCMMTPVFFHWSLTTSH